MLGRMQAFRSLPLALAALVVALLAACRAPAGSAGEVEGVLAEVADTVEQRFFDPTRLPAFRAARAAAEARARRGELSAAVNEWLATLGASHTEFRTRAEPRAWELADVFWESLPGPARERAFGTSGPVLEGIGLVLGEHDGEVFVRGVLDGSPAERAGVRVGERPIACEGAPFRAVDSWRGRAGRPTRLALRSPAGAGRELVVVPDALRPRERYLAALRASARVTELDGKRLAYVHAWSYAGEEVQATLRELLLEGELAGADGLVLDLRDGLGGANPDALALFARDVPELEWRERDGSVQRSSSAWRKPVALLIDEHTTSGKEILAHSFQRAGRGLLVGARTAGEVVGGSLFLLGDGSVLYLAVRDVRVDGERLEGVGVTPDVLVPFAREAGGADEPLARARAELRAHL